MIKIDNSQNLSITYGGGGGNRTRVRGPSARGRFSGCSPCIGFPRLYPRAGMAGKARFINVGIPSPCVGNTQAGVSDTLRQATRKLTGSALPFYLGSESKFSFGTCCVTAVNVRAPTRSFRPTVPVESIRPLKSEIKYKAI